jgi:hypothetical protein
MMQEKIKPSEIIDSQIGMMSEQMKLEYPFIIMGKSLHQRLCKELNRNVKTYRKFKVKVLC